MKSCPMPLCKNNLTFSSLGIRFTSLFVCLFSLFSFLFTNANEIVLPGAVHCEFWQLTILSQPLTLNSAVQWLLLRNLLTIHWDNRRFWVVRKYNIGISGLGGNKQTSINKLWRRLFFKYLLLCTYTGVWLS